MNHSFESLLEAYLTNSMTVTEREQFLDQLADGRYDRELDGAIDETLRANLYSQQATDPRLGELIYRQMKLVEDAGTPVRFMTILHKWGWAAAVILVLGLGAYWWAADKKNDIPAAVVTDASAVQPGRNGAVLTLADGSQVVLDSIDNGVVASQGGATAKVVNGGLRYEGSGIGTVYNTISTPKGRQFHVTLPDGTDVWLNAASSIRYPTAFSGKERRVAITGEAYFEVAKNASMPFRVEVNDAAVVEVLGTHFNINAYADEGNMHTTLLEGSVRLTAIHPNQDGQPSVMLEPRQQAVLSVGDQPHIKVMSDAGIDKIMAWKNGLFDFEGLSLEEMMRQLERWYDIRIVIKSHASSSMFGGKMYRNVPLSDLLEVLKKMGIKSEWDGQTLTIL